MRSFGNIRFPDLPGGLITRPTLEWLLDNVWGGRDMAEERRELYEAANRSAAGSPPGADGLARAPHGRLPRAGG